MKTLDKFISEYATWLITQCLANPLEFEKIVIQADKSQLGKDFAVACALCYKDQEQCKSIRTIYREGEYFKNFLAGSSFELDENVFERFLLEEEEIKIRVIEDGTMEFNVYDVWSALKNSYEKYYNDR